MYTFIRAVRLFGVRNISHYFAMESSDEDDQKDRAKFDPHVYGGYTCG